MSKRVVRLQNAIALRNERGAAMAEYGLLLALVFVVVVAILGTLGGRLEQLFGFAAETVDNSPALKNP